MSKNSSSGSAALDKPSGASGEYSLGDYVVVNLVVWSLLLIVGLIAYFGIDKAPVVPFLLLVVGCGFTVVSIYDWAFERAASRSGKHGTAER